MYDGLPTVVKHNSHERQYYYLVCGQIDGLEWLIQCNHTPDNICLVKGKVYIGLVK